MFLSARKPTSSKAARIGLVVLISYLILRGISFYKNQPAELPGELFSYNGKDVRYLCKGSGEPFVIFETGFGSDSEETWSNIVETLPDTVTSCYYDRLGHGGSSDVPTSFTTEEKSQVQEALISHIAGNKPVILVAKSYGGILARRTAKRAQVNLAALIFLDSAHENQHNILRGHFSPIADYVKYWHYADAALGLSDIKNVFKLYDSEMEKRLDHYYSSFRYAHVLSTYRNEKGFYTPLDEFGYDFGELKMKVLSHDREVYAHVPRFYNIGDKWANMQKSLAALSKNSEHIVVSGATHNIPKDRPDAVVANILDVIEAQTKLSKL